MDRITEDPLRILRYFRLASSSDYGKLEAVTDLGYLELFEAHALTLVTQVTNHVVMTTLPPWLPR